MLTIALFVLALANFARTVPVSTLKVDQRQEGDINVRADLENFVILIIPTTSSNFGLLDLLSKAVPMKSSAASWKKKQQQQHHQVKQATETSEAQNFIESKTAPYHVDISHISKSKLEPQVEKNEEILNSRSKSEEKRELGRFAKAILVTVPLDEDERKEGTRRIPEQLQLLGAPYEQCGPDGYRDKHGTCVYVPGEIFA